MQNRYGSDLLGTVCLAAALLFSLLSRIFILRPLILLSYILLFICFYRLFSKNIAKRAEENRKFIAFWNRLKTRISAKYRQISKKYRNDPYSYFYCPKCSFPLRAPRGKGRIRVTCSQCGHQFIKKV